VYAELPDRNPLITIRFSSLVTHVASPVPDFPCCLTSYRLQVGDARLSQDALIADRFVTPWSATLSTSIGLAMKARANVKTARLELDSARAA